MEKNTAVRLSICIYFLSSLQKFWNPLMILKVLSSMNKFRVLEFHTNHENISY